MKPTFKNSAAAFNEAIKQGRLNTNHQSPLYAGNWMYMGTWSDGIGLVDQFKNIDTRKYLETRKD